MNKFERVEARTSYEGDTLQNPRFNNTLFTNSISFKNAVFKDTADFQDSKFEKRVLFDSTIFKKFALFVGTKFKSYVSYKNAVFDSIMSFTFMPDIEGSVIFNNSHFKQEFFIGDATNFKEKVFFNMAVFKGSVHIEGNVFYDETHFEEAHVQSEAYFNNTFKSTSNFNKTSFDSLVSFDRTVFDSTVTFNSTKFLDNTSFEGVIFNGEVSFDSTIFSKSLSFKKARFDQKVTFNKVILPDTIYFSDLQQITKDVIFTFPTLRSGQRSCVIDLYGTDINKFEFDYTYFQLLYNSSLPKNHIINLYERVLKMQKDRGFLEGYEKADKEYQHLILTYETYGLEYIWCSFISKARWWWWDYGYEKGRILIISIIFLLIFTSVNTIFFQKMNESVYDIEAIYARWKKNQEPSSTTLKDDKFHISKHTIYASFFYTWFIFLGLRDFESWIGVLYLLFQYGLGLICVAFLANYVIVS